MVVLPQMAIERMKIVIECIAVIMASDHCYCLVQFIDFNLNLSLKMFLSVSFMFAVIFLLPRSLFL